MDVAVTLINEEEIVVDKLIAASQRRGEVALPSEGRRLVPYFVPGASVLSEDTLNVNTDVDAFRRDGASVLDIPVPVGRIGVLTAINRKQRIRSKKCSVVGADWSPTSPLDSTPLSSPEDSDSTEYRPNPTDSTPVKEPRTPVRKGVDDEALSLSAPSSIRDGAGFAMLERSVVRKKISKSKVKKTFVTPTNGTPLFSSVPSSPEVFGGNGPEMLSSFLVLSEKWAGPAYAMSPPPCDLPLPRFQIKAEVGSGSRLPSQSGYPLKTKAVRPPARAAHSAPVSPTLRAKCEQKVTEKDLLLYDPSLEAPHIVDENDCRPRCIDKAFEPPSNMESLGAATVNLKKMLRLS